MLCCVLTHLAHEHTIQLTKVQYFCHYANFWLEKYGAFLGTQETKETKEKQGKTRTTAYSINTDSNIPYVPQVLFLIPAMWSGEK